MGLQFLIGRSGTEKSDYIIQDIRTKLQEHPDGKPIFYIVPDQMTFQQEYELFSNNDLPGSIRAQVVSFSRLAWRVIQETGGSTKRFISSVGMQMLLRKVISERPDEWNVFGKALDKQGFLQQIERLLTEFKRHNILPEDMTAHIADIEKREHEPIDIGGLTGKLDDLHYVYQEMTQTLTGTYIDTEDQVNMLIEKIPVSSLFHGAHVYIDGFHRFTPQELLVLQTMMQEVETMTVALTLDPEDMDVESELDLFYQTKETYDAICTAAAESPLKLKPHISFSPATDKFNNRPYFQHLESYFDIQPHPPYPEKVPIQIAEAVHIRAEVEGVAQQILRLVRDKNYRFRDIALFMREPEDYESVLSTLFEDYGIPVFMDEKKSMLHHALIEFVRSSLEVVDSNWRSDALFRVLKTGLIQPTHDEYPLTEDAIDQLENYVLEYGIRSRKQWTAEEPWIFQRFFGFDDAHQTSKEIEKQRQINAYREQVADVFAPFDQAIRNGKTIKERATAVYLFLEELHIPEQLEKMSVTYDEYGMPEKGREQEQVWDALVQLLDEIVELSGNENVRLSDFRDFLDAGFETLEFSHIPPSMDHVIVGSIDQSRIQGVSCTFLLGVNEGTWPMRPPTDGILNEYERELLAMHGMELAESSTRQLLDDWFYMYLAFTSARDYMWISYVISDQEGKTKLPSQLIPRIQSLYPNIGTPLLLQDPDELLEADRFITTPVKTRAALTVQLARYERGYAVKPIWLHVLNWYIQNEMIYSPTYNVLQSVLYRNRPTSLTEETVKQLYPPKKPVAASVSRLEMHYRCSYQHFAHYHLKLEERKRYTLDAPDIGQLFHEALKMITEWIQTEKKGFSDVTKKDAATYAQKAVHTLAPILQHRILHSSNRYQYMQKKLQEIIARATYVLSEQARATDFSPVGVEVGFGNAEDVLSPLILPLPNGYELMLRGRIDRVDQAMINEQLYLRIIDYKSSDRGLDLLEVYYGLALQMLTYLDVVLAQSEQWLGLQASPAGVLYFHVHNAMLLENTMLPEDVLDHQLFKEYKMKGLLQANEQVAQLMDKTLETGHSQVVPFALKKNGEFQSTSKVAGEETFMDLRNHIHTLITHAGISITSGEVELNPFEYDQRSACTFCPFSSVCQFDPQIQDNTFRRLQKMSDEKVIEYMQKRGDAHGQMDR